MQKDLSFNEVFMKGIVKGDVKRGTVIFCRIVIKVENNTTLCSQIVGVMRLFQHTLLNTSNNK